MAVWEVRAGVTPSKSKMMVVETQKVMLVERIVDMI